jgi:UDP-N-acetylglucosamine 2-epimerase
MKKDMKNAVRVLFVFGTRPEAVKLAPLIKLTQSDARFEAKVCVTAQHRLQMDQVLRIFDIKPDFDLDIMSRNQTPATVTAKALAGVDEVIAAVKPDVVLVQGDTATVFAGALAAFYHKVKVGHIEAGLRSHRKYEPFPEEISRVLTTRLADFHFAPTQLSKRNLLNEQTDENSIYVTGNTALDVFKYTVIDRKFNAPFLNDIDYATKRVIVVTTHRRENLGEPIAGICGAVKRIADNFQDVEIVYSVHLNPLVKDTVHSILGGLPNVHLTDTPLDLLDIHNLFNKSYIIMTDSGGIQEEAPSFGKPVLVLRNTTERPEGIETGALMLAGTNGDTVYEMAARLLTDTVMYAKMRDARNPYGDGKASERIAAALLYEFGLTDEKPTEFS